MKVYRIDFYDDQRILGPKTKTVIAKSADSALKILYKNTFVEDIIGFDFVSSVDYMEEN